ncbi:hypothetical protein ACRALDRAFT_1065430 [Sodiomyces alcalophilus JCM 7366]|uniref:uncharacterized protein n=1 Tax=Sodiomyces alcalophilus JCM 7366 TaxID=591952 RepID=UPI0039B59400
MSATSLHPAATRKAEACSPLTAQTRRHDFTLTGTSSPPSVSPNSVESPEPLSINAVLREHHRTRLYVSPLKWTADHLQLLGCHFTSRPLASESSTGSDVPDASIEGTEGQLMAAGVSNISQDTVVEAATHILSTRSNEIKTLYVQAILDAHGFHYAHIGSVRPRPPPAVYTHFQLPLYFHRRVVTTLRLEGVFSCSSTPNVPCLGYIDLKNLGVRRDKSIKLSSTTSRANWPIARLRARHRRRIRPAQEEEDPYIVAVLIALAQQQQSRFVAEGKAAAGVDATIAVHLFALPTDGQSLYFYAARIPLAFLDGLDHPSRHFPGGSFHVPYHCIPLTSKVKMIRGLGYAFAVIRSRCTWCTT